MSDVALPGMATNELNEFSLFPLNLYTVVITTIIAITNSFSKKKKKWKWDMLQSFIRYKCWNPMGHKV